MSKAPYLQSMAPKIRFFFKINIFVILLISVGFRIIDLEHIPGINGDEAWYGVQMLALRSGEPFAWRTPTGNLVNPFFSGIVYLLHLFSPPDIWVLRAPAVLTGILAFLLTYGLIGKVLGRNIAMIAALLVATLPINIAYSRLGWDPSESVLIGVIAIYFSLKHSRVGVALSQVIAVIIHPTNIFLLPFLLIPFIPDTTIDRVRAIVWRQQREFLSLNKKQPAYIALIILATIYLFLASVAVFSPDRFQESILGSVFLLPRHLIYFFGYYSQLLSGVTIYRYIVGIEPTVNWLLHDGIFWILCVFLLVVGVQQLFKERQWNFLALIFGLLPTLLWFLTIAKLRAIMPDHERYAMCLIMPSILVVSILIDAIARAYQKRWLGLTLAICISWLYLWSFQVHYFDALRVTGSLAHRTYHTAAVEPKKQVLDLVIDDAKNIDDVAIYAEDWWLYWPVRYLASPHQKIHVYSLEDISHTSNKLNQSMNSGAYLATFSGSQIDSDANKIYPDSDFRRWYIKDYGNKQLITLTHKKNHHSSD